MTKKVNTKGNGRTPTPEPEPNPVKEAIESIESDLGTIHAGRAAAQARKEEPSDVVKARLRAALEPKREVVKRFVEEFTPALGYANQVLALDKQTWPPTVACQTALRAATRAASQFLNAVTRDHVREIEALIESLRNSDLLYGEWEPHLMERIAGLDLLEKYTREDLEGMRFNVAILKKHAPQPVEEITRPEAETRPAEKAVSTLTDYEVFP